VRRRFPLREAVAQSTSSCGSTTCASRCTGASLPITHVPSDVIPGHIRADDRRGHAGDSRQRFRTSRDELPIP
jgi:hypothetical protein